MQDVGTGRIFFVHGVVHVAHRGDGVVEAHGDEVDGLGRVDLALRVLRQSRGGRDDVAAPVGHGVERTHPLGDRVAELPRRFDDLVEDAVRVAEVAADDVPVRLLALHLQLEQVDQHRLHVLAELLRRDEPLLGVLTPGGLGTRAARRGSLASFEGRAGTSAVVAMLKRG